MISLPYDILEEIVNCIDTSLDAVEPYQTLNAMSLTCRAMLQLCRKQRYNTMILAPRDWDFLNHLTSPASFRLRSLSLNPTIFRIKTVERLANSSPDILKNVRKLFLRSGESNYNDAALLALLEKFDNLQFLSIQAGNFMNRSQPINWKLLPLPYQQSLVQLINRSPLNNLTIQDHSEFPLDILPALRRLLNLTVKDTTFSSSLSEYLSMPVTGPLQLTELWIVVPHIENFVQLLQPHSVYGHPIIDPASIETLTIELESVDSAAWDRNSLNRISRLEHLYMMNPVHSYTNFLNDVLHGLHPNSVASLEYLRYEIEYTPPSRDEWPLPSSVIRGFEFNSLETLEIYLDMHPAYEMRVLEDLLEMDKILASPNFPILKWVKIDVAHDNDLLHTEQWQSVPRTHFNRILSNSAIEFDLVVAASKVGF